MVDVTRREPRQAQDYDSRSARAARSVLVELTQILGSFHGKFAVIGGMVPWLLLDNPEMPHVGTLDVDLSLDAEALGDGEYATLIQALLQRGYEQRSSYREFQLVRRVPGDDGAAAIDVVVDFLMPIHAVVRKNRPPIVANFRVQRADGADLAVLYQQRVSVVERMPGGGVNQVEVAVATIPALLAMKGSALAGRYKEKDAYDVYYCVRNYPGGARALAEMCRPLLQHPSAVAGYRVVARKFESIESVGPKWVRDFVVNSDVLGDRTADQWQVDAHGQLSVWWKSLGLDH
jgi:Nucleotidyl transferase AbiEii toxin, Type IV TA system